jgi:hypothetical protein
MMVYNSNLLLMRFCNEKKSNFRPVCDLVFRLFLKLLFESNQFKTDLKTKVEIASSPLAITSLVF